jgi:hypothetical protein
VWSKERNVHTGFRPPTEQSSLCRTEKTNQEFIKHLPIDPASAPSNNLASTSELEKTMSKFLPVKREGDHCEKNAKGKNIQSSQKHTCEENVPVQPPSYASNHNKHACPTWNGHADGLGKTFPVANSAYFGYMNTHALDLGMNPTLPQYTATCPPQGYLEAQMFRPNGFFPSASHGAQYNPYTFSPSHASFGSPPAYPYAMCAQHGYQGGQYPPNGFYSPQGAQMKTTPDFSRTIMERPLDLPSIGSFLEYLNEV